MNAWVQTSTGRALNFAAPVVKPQHLFTEIAHGLALIARFSGQTDMPVSVAQHSLLMAEEAEAETGDPELAAFCLLHDAHEAYFGDWPSPAAAAVGQAMAAAAQAAGAPDFAAASLTARFKAGIRQVKAELDRAIITAAGLDPARFAARADEIHAYDIQALLTERRDRMRPAPAPWATDLTPDGKPLRRKMVKPMPWPVAEERFAAALRRLCPDAALAASRAA